MIVNCLHCKNELTAEVAERVLLICPDCEFLFALSPGGKPEVPTYSEEETLPRPEAHMVVSAGQATRLDATVLTDNADILAELPLPQGKQLFCEVLSSPDGGLAKGTVIRFSKGRVVFGRADAEVILPDERVSRKHAAIEAISRENIYVRDLASTNGSFLNGHRVSTSKVRSGDELRFGGTSLRFFAEDE